MKKYFLLISIFCLPFVMRPFACFAAQTLSVAFGETLPPYVIPETDEGIVVDILREALEPEGFSIEAHYYPYARRLIAYKKGKVDVVSDVHVSLAENFDGYFSGAVYAYQNIVISLKKNEFVFNSVRDLVNYRVLGWQGAKDSLGEEYAEMTEQNVHYREIANQKAQVVMLFREREDVIQMDTLIFQYYRNELLKEGYTEVKQDVDIFSFFDISENGFVFRDQHIQELFNRKLEELKQSGRYDEIIQKYIGMVR